MTALCPACGYHLETIGPEAELGDLIISAAGGCSWKGQPVPLTAGEHTIAFALAAAKGGILKREALENAMGREYASNVLTVLLHRVRRAFREIDPEFDRIETVRGAGVRWRVGHSGIAINRSAVR